MARLLTDADYQSVSYSDAVKALIVKFYPQWLFAEQVGQQEMAGWLAQRYIIDQIFTNTTTWSHLLLYKAKNLIQYTETEFDDGTPYTGNPVWDVSTAYPNGSLVNHNGYRYTLNSFGGNTGTEPGTDPIWVVGAETDRVLYKDKIYECIAAATGFLPTNTTYWTYICNNNDFYFATLPYNEWTKSNVYAIGDQVWFLDKVYTATIANTNIIPTSSSQIWGSGVSYAVASGTFPDNTTYWTKGDNRNPQIVRYLLDCAFYHFERAVPARDFPDRIKEAYDGNGPNQTGGVIGWLKKVAEGIVNVDIPEIIVTTGLSITSGNSLSTNTGLPPQSRDNFLWS